MMKDSLILRPEKTNIITILKRGSSHDLEKVLESGGFDVNKAVRSVSPFNPPGWTPLIYACRNHNIEVIQLLLKNGADPGLVTETNFAPIWAVLSSTSDYFDNQMEESALACAKILINAGLALPDIPIQPNGRTLLTQLILKHSVKLFDYFLEQGVDPNQRDNSGFLPLNLAVSKNLMEFVKSLKKHDANPFMKNQSGESCLNFVDKDNKEMYNFLTTWRKTFTKKDVGKFNKLDGCNSEEENRNMALEKMVMEMPVKLPIPVISQHTEENGNIEATILSKEMDCVRQAVDWVDRQYSYRETLIATGNTNDQASPFYDGTDDFVFVNYDALSSPTEQTLPRPPPSNSSDDSSKSDKGTAPAREEKQDQDNPSISSCPQNLLLIIGGTAALTLIASHFFRKFMKN